MTRSEEHGASRRPPWRRRFSSSSLPFFAVLVVVLAGFVRIMGYHWRQGATLIGGALLLAAVLRAVLSSEQVGLIAIRGKGLDVLAYTAFGVLMIAVALTID